MKELRLWLGKRGELANEVDAFIDYLRQACASRMSLALSPEESSGFDWVCDPNPRAHTCVEAGTLTIFTSGTTGAPTPHAKDATRLIESKRGRGSANDRWLLTYHPFRWAGISLIAHVLRTRSNMVVPRSLDLDDILAAAPGATHVSLTPSLFRKLLIMADHQQLRQMPFAQVTFGGEEATQAVLDEAHDLWPAARITHTYASTDHGDICSVSDGLAGFPRHKFASFHLDSEGQLHIRGLATGDIWRLDGDRYHFVGRTTDVVNVGGSKVHLAAVERATLAIPGVRQARATAVPSALLGQVISLEYVGDPEPLDVRKALRAILPKVACPASATRVESIVLTAAGKVGH